jgi:DNA-binding transcriptional ArsR family regulator
MVPYTESDFASMTLPLRAMANVNRLQILHWLNDPRSHFPAQIDGDLVTDGVCVGFITEKIGLRQPTVTAHLQLLQAAGLVSSKKIKNWVFYKINGPESAEVLQMLRRGITRKLPLQDHGGGNPGRP